MKNVVFIVTQLGMNQTFCTTLRDRSGTIPFYLRLVEVV